MRREYCDDCDPNAGEHDGNWSDATERTDCKRCGPTYEYYPSDKPGVYCWDCVGAAEGQLPDNPSVKGERVTVSCQSCGDDLEVRPARIDEQKRGSFCTLECYGDWLSATVVGPAHHQWEGGPIEYGRSWWRVRRRAFENPEDAHTLENVVTLCRSCHRRAEEGQITVSLAGEK